MKKEKTPVYPIWEESELRICRFCAFGARISTSEEEFCEKKKQIIPEDNSCKKYKYDILKKELRRRKPETKKFTKGDFEI